MQSSTSSSIGPSPATVQATLSYVTISDQSHTPRRTPISGLDATAILKDGVDRVHKLRMRGYATAVITENIDIPLDLARSWIGSTFPFVQQVILAR